MERFNRTLLEDWAYVRVYRPEHARTRALARRLHQYNHHRRYSALGGLPPVSRVTNQPPGSVHLDTLIDLVREYAGHETMLARVTELRPTGGDFRDYAEHALAHRSRHIIFRWMERLRAMPPWRERDLSTEDLIDHAAVVLKVIEVRLYYASHQAFFDHHPEALDQSGVHARHRIAQDIGVVPTVEEYVFLRDQIWRELSAHAPETLAGLLEVEQAINGALDAVIMATMREYLRESNGLS